MPNKIIKNKKQYMLGKQGSLNSQAGDEAWADSFSTAVTGLDASWTTPIDLSTTTPTGLTTATINSEVRITQVDLRSQVTGMGKLTGSIDIPEWENLKECTLIATYHNAFTTNYPNAVHKIGAKLEHLYICIAQSGDDVATNFPHELYRSGLGTYDAPKTKDIEENVIQGTINSDIDNLTGLKNYYLNFTDDWTGNIGLNNSPNQVNGIQNFPDNIWNISTLVAVNFYENWNVAGSNNTGSFPNSIGHLTDLELIQLGGGTGSGWNAVSQGFMTGSYPSDIDTLTSLREMNMDNNDGMTGFPDLSGSPDMVLINYKGSSFSGQFPSWLVDGSIESSGGNSWQHFDNLQLAGPSGSDFASGDFNPTRAGLSGSMPEPAGGVQMAFVDLFNVKLNDLEGAVPDTYWENSIKKMDWSYTRIDSLATDPKSVLLNLTQTANFMFKYCHIGPEPLPNLDWTHFGTNSITYAWFQGNNYVFSNLLYVPSNAPSGETCLALWQDRSSNGILYAPQRNFGSQSNYDSGTGIIDFSGIVTHTDNVYEWQLDGTTISGETTASIDTDSYGAGTYQLIVTNTGAPDLTLNSVTITV